LQGKESFKKNSLSTNQYR